MKAPPAKCLIDGYATHVPVLIACLQNTTGPILELGAGLYSTPIVHAFSVLGRYGRTVEINAEWAARIRALFEGIPFVSTKHDILTVRDPEETNLKEHQWSVALVDHETHHRARDLRTLKELGAEIIIVHDTQDVRYGCNPVLETFRYRHDFEGWGWPTTTAVSDVNDLLWLADALEHSCPGN